MLKNKITVIGLGAGDLAQLPLGIYRQLIQTTEPVYLRTADHPVVASLAAEGVRFTSFDDYYEQTDHFADVYEQIVATLLAEAKQQSLIYAVPGHPMLAEFTVQLLLAQDEVSIDVQGGHSFLDALFTRLKIDPIEGFQFLDGTAFDRRVLNYEQHTIFCQVYDQYVASEVKLALLEDLPADYPVTIVEAVGTEAEELLTVPLEALDRSLTLSNLTSVYLPPVPRTLLRHQFSYLTDVIATLRGPEGCAWDRAQTHETLRPYLIEEVYELIDAINAQDDDRIIDELGDVLLQVMLHSQIGADAGYFTIADVIKGLVDKMVHRHPHVFDGAPADKDKSWEELKQTDQSEQAPSLLARVATSLPALAKAEQLQAVAAQVGFDWDEAEPIWAKLTEEIAEVQEAIASQDEPAIEAELGDVLFVIANLARHYDVNPELALSRTNNKFSERFAYIEAALERRGKALQDSNLAEMDYYWDEAKKKGR